MSLNKMLALIVALPLTLILASCKQEESTAIVIPPGGQVQFSTKGFLYYSDDLYEVLLRSYGSGDNRALKTALDITPQGNAILSEDVHSVIVPKGMQLSGSYVVQVLMKNHALQPTAFVFGSEPVEPSITTTLVYEVLSKYPNKPLANYSQGQIERLYQYVNSTTSARMEEFGLKRTMNPDILYRFAKNSLSSNPEFLGLLKEVGCVFDYDANGNVALPPFPFGEPNNAPVLDLNFSTAPGTVTGIENSLLEVKAQASDPDGDLIFYIWERDGVVVQRDIQSYIWTPGYFDSRPAPYPVQAKITDGGKVLSVTWNLEIADLNRRPVSLANCPTSVKEGEVWVCKVKATDPDGDPVTWTLVDAGLSAKPTMNGVNAPGDFIAEEVELRWKPDNDDAKKQNAYLEVRSSDGKLGIDVRGFTLTVEDSNQAPGLSGTNPLATNPSHLIAREWDICLNQDPDNGGAYTFDLTVVDPDNLTTTTPRATPRDKVTIDIQGTLKTDITENGATVDPDGLKTVFHYTWKPTNGKRSGVLSLTISDDHGLSRQEEITLSAEDRNQIPCMNPRTAKISKFVDDKVTTTDLSRDASDGDADIPIIQSEAIGSDILPFLTECATGKALYLTRRADQTNSVYRTNLGTGKHCIRGVINPTGGGVIHLARASEHTASVSIPAGTVLTTNYAASGVRMTYETVVAATFDSMDRVLSIPIRAINRTAAIGTLTVITAAVDTTGITVTNETALTGNGTLKFTVSPAPTSDRILPKGTLVSTNDSVSLQTIRYELTDNVTIAAGQTTISVVAQRQKVTVPSGQTFNLGTVFAGPAITATNNLAVNDEQPYTLYTYRSSNEFCWVNKAYDGQSAQANEITMMPTPISGVSVGNSASFLIDGQVQFTRTTNPGSVSIPQGFVVKTPNGKRYTVDNAATMATGVPSISVKVSRVMDSTSDSPQMCLGMRDYNYQPYFVSGVLTTSVVEGNALLAHNLQVTDSQVTPADINKPGDPDDRFIYTITSSGTPPTGQWKFCRAPGDNASNLDSPTCVPCSNVTGLTNLESSRCYFRFKPAATDVAATFRWDVSVNDQGATYPANSNSTTSVFAVAVEEINDPPVITQNNFTTPIAATQAAPADGQTFVEGQEGSFNFYVADPDKGSNFNTVTATIESTMFDIQKNQWVSRPSTITVSKTNAVVPSGGMGNNQTYVVKWKPSDAEAKAFSSSQGLLLKIKLVDSVADVSKQKTTYGHFAIKVRNSNNAPVMSANMLKVGTTTAVPSPITVIADTYISYEFTATDADGTIPAGGTFSTNLTACRDSGNLVSQHPTLDFPAADPIDCHVKSPQWPTELTTYDASYMGNSAVANCRVGGTGLSSTLKADLAVPKLTRMSQTTSSGVTSVRYRMEWCPQKGQLGEHAGTFLITDNGDTARDGTTSNALNGSLAVRLKVQSPVYFISPRLDLNGVPQHFMPQTAAAMTQKPFTYKTIVKNTKNNALLYSLISPPTGMTINSSTGVITWVPTSAQISNDPYKVTVKVQDKVNTTETDTVFFFMKVHSSLSPIEAVPEITALNPANTAMITLREKQSRTFEVTATDANTNDELFYRWYVDGVLKDDEGYQFKYEPGDKDASVDGDGSGPLKIGEHTIMVEVTDGNNVVSQSWTVKVLNNLLVPEPIFTFADARAASTYVATTKANVTNLAWLTELGVHTVIGTQNVDYIMFSGSYSRTGTQKHFLWSIQIVDGALSNPNYSSSMSYKPWNFFEEIGWGTNKTQRIAYSKASETTFDVMLTSTASRVGGVSTTATGLNMRHGDLTAFKSASLTACSGTCPSLLYGELSYGSRATATMMASGNQHVFWAADDGKSINWDVNRGTPVAFANYGTAVIGGITLNAATKRLYVSTSDLVNRVYKLHTYDVNPVTSGSTPALVSSVDMYDGIPANLDTSPTDIAVDPATNRVYVWLAGIGGLATMIDDGTGTPNNASFSYVGVAAISSSAADVASSGRRLVFDSSSKMLIGVSRTGKQVFTVDPSSMTVYTYSTSATLDAIVSFPESGLVYLVDRTAGVIYRGY